MAAKILLLLAPVAAWTPGKVLDDFFRAKSTRPRPHLLGETPGHTRAALNNQLARSGAHDACDEFEHEHLDALLEALEGATDAALTAVYGEADGRHPAKANSTLPRGAGAFDLSLIHI